MPFKTPPDIVLPSELSGPDFVGSSVETVGSGEGVRDEVGTPPNVGKGVGVGSILFRIVLQKMADANINANGTNFIAIKPP